MTRIKKLSQIETEIYNGMSFEMAEKVLFASRYMVYLSLGDNDNEINAIKDLIQNECKIKNIDYGNFNFENRSEVTDSILFKAIWDYSRSNPTILHDFGVIPFWVNAIKEMPIEK